MNNITTAVILKIGVGAIGHESTDEVSILIVRGPHFQKGEWEIEYMTESGNEHWWGDLGDDVRKYVESDPDKVFHHDGLTNFTYVSNISGAPVTLIGERPTLEIHIGRDILDHIVLTTGVWRCVAYGRYDMKGV